MVKHNTPIDYYSYDQYGTRTCYLGPCQGEMTPFGFTGQYTDFRSSGMLYMRARSYDPETQQFLSRDPIGVANQPYVYANRNPINFVDPTGTQAEPGEGEDWEGGGIGVEPATGAAVPGGGGGAETASAVEAAAGAAGTDDQAANGAEETETAGNGETASVPKIGGGPRMRHYTNRAGLRGILKDMLIKGNPKSWMPGCVFCEPANQRPRPQDVVERFYRLDPGHGRDYVEFNTAPGEAFRVTNPRTGNTEWVIQGDVSLLGRDPQFFQRR